MVVVKSLYDTSVSKTPFTRSGVNVVKPLIPTSSPILSRGTSTTEAPKVTEKKSLLSKAKETISGLNKKNISEYLKSGLKMLPSQAKQAYGIILSNFTNQQRQNSKLFSPIIGVGLPQLSKQSIQTLEKTSEKVKEEGFQKQKQVSEELAKKVEPSTGLQSFLEQLAFNLPQMVASTGLSVATALVTKNPLLATTVNLSTSYGLNASEVYQEARLKGLSDSQAMPLSTLGGVVIGALDFIPIERLIRKTGVSETIEKTIKKRIIDGIIDTAIQSGTEGATEALQEIIGGAIAKTYDENRDIFEGVTTAGLIGMLFGGGANIGVSGIMGIKGTKSTADFVEETENKVSESLDTPPEKRTEEQKEIVNTIFNQTITADQAMSYVIENNLNNTDDGKKIVKLVAEAKRTNQNIKISPTEDESGLDIELVSKEDYTKAKQTQLYEISLEDRQTPKYYADIRDNLIKQAESGVKEVKINGKVKPIEDAIGTIHSKAISSTKGNELYDENYVGWRRTNAFLAGKAERAKTFDDFVNSLLKKGETRKNVDIPTLRMVFNKVKTNTRIAQQLLTEKKISLSNEAYQDIVKNGGVTVSLEGNKPAKGYSYAPSKGTEVKIKASDFTEKDVTDYIDKYYRELSKEGNHLGAWEDDGYIYLDIAQVGIPSIGTLQKAQDAKQLAVFDLESISGGWDGNIRLGKIEKGVYSKIDEASNIFDKYQRQIKGTTQERGSGGTTEVSKQPSKEKPKVKTRQVPKEQLPIGEGKIKASKLEARLKGIVGSATQEQIDELGLSTYRIMNKADQIQKASEYVVNNRQEALDVLQGKKNAPKGLIPESIYVAMTELAKEDIDLATKLSTLQATALGQRIGILSEIDKNNPIKFLNEIYKIREGEFKRKYKGKSVAEAKKTIAKDIDSKIKAPDKYDWSKFLDSIECT